jgi:hypothetical protein
MSWRTLLALASSLSLFVSFGCGPKAAADKMNEAKGKVTSNGNPVDRVTMTFVPADAKMGREDVCIVNNGEFSTKLVAGKYKVAFEPAQGGTNIPAKYRSADTSGLEIDASHTVDKSFTLD